MKYSTRKRETNWSYARRNCTQHKVQYNTVQYREAGMSAGNEHQISLEDRRCSKRLAGFIFWLGWACVHSMYVCKLLLR